MTSISDLQRRITDTESVIVVYEQRTHLEATELRVLLDKLYGRLAAARGEAWRLRQREIVDKLAEVSDALHRRTDSRSTG